MPRGVQKADLYGTNFKFVLSIHLLHVGHGYPSDLLQPFRFMFVHIDRHGILFHQLSQPSNFNAKNFTSHMVGMVMSHQRTGQLHAVFFHDFENPINIPRRVDHHAFAGFPISDQVYKVGHRTRRGVLGSQIDPG